MLKQKTSFLFVLTLIFLTFLIQISNSLSSTKNEIIARVENQIITSYEMKNKIRTILFLSNQEINQNNINLIKNQALQQLIIYKLKKNSVIKSNIKISNNVQLNKYLENISERFNTDINGLEKIFDNNNLDYIIYKDEIENEFK